MKNEELQKLAKEQVSIFSYSGDNEIAAINGFVLGFNYLNVAVHDILNSPKFAELLINNFKEVNDKTVEAFKKEFLERTKLSPQVVETYSEFLGIFFKRCYESGNQFAIACLKQIINLE